MGKKCTVCGQEVEGKFCPNCGNKAVEEGTVVTQEVADYMKTRLENKKNHGTYKMVVGIIMTILGTLILVGGLDDGVELLGDLADYDTTLAFVVPGVLTIIAGVMLIVSKFVKELLPISGVAFLVAAIVNMIGISNISILAILGIIVGILNIVYFFNKK